MAFHTPTDPCRRLWPIASSRKKSGMPRRNRLRKYGIKNAPAMEKKLII